MKYIFIFCLLCSQFTYGQKITKAEKKIVANIKGHIGYLADDKLEGRRTGSAGEKLAYEYIISEFKKAGLSPGLREGYLQPFEINEGKKINSETSFSVNNQPLELHTDFFPLAYSANATVSCDVSQSLKEAGEIWFLDLADMLKENSNNPHFDVDEKIRMEAAKVAGKGATGLVVYNTSGISDNIKFDEKSKIAAVQIPVLYLTKNAKTKYLSDEINMQSLKVVVHIGDKKRVGHNVIGVINNNAPTTIVLGAHYDHLGYGEDHNSLYAGTEPMIHNGADDNASGTAALIELARLVNQSSLKKNNYVFVAFSGEELGLYGSKYFTENSTVSLASVNYMINMDMVGRLNDSTHGLSIGGYGTSPAWGRLVKKDDNYFKIKLDSSGTGPSDHTSFYIKDIPVLFFFTGTHMDYHKPGDDADKVNYTGAARIISFIFNLLKSTDKEDKLAFSKTKDAPAMAKSSFKVTLGVMLDYTYSGHGVHVDAVSSGRPAEKAGIKAGDVLIQLGDHKFADVQEYMGALNKFNKGDATKIKLLRGKDELVLDIVF